MFKPKHKKVFAIWYTKGIYEQIVDLLKELHISLEVCNVDRKDFEGDEDTHWQQGDGYFPEEGIVTIQQVSIKEDVEPRWKITLEVEDCALWKYYGPNRFSFSPQLILRSWDSNFDHFMYGMAAEWGLR